MRFLLLLLAVVATAIRVPAQEGAVQAFFNEFTDDWMRRNPNATIAARYFSGEEQARLERQLTPQTDAWRRERVELARQGLTRLRTLDRARMNETERVSADLMQWQLDTIIVGEQYADHSFPLNQFNGANVDLPNTLTVSHPLLTDRDADNYVARLALVGQRMDEAVADARRIAGKGLLPPKFILQATVTQMQRFIEPPPAQNPFVTVFAQRMGAIREISEAKRETYRSRAERLVASEIYPSWRRGIALLTPMVGRATDDAGLWRFKDGEAAYAAALRRFTSTTLGADEIHQLGLRQVARIETQMDALLKRLGRTDGSVKARIDKLKQDLAYPLTEDGRKAIMADVELMLRDAERRAALQFDRRPKAPVVAQPYPRFREANAAASYTAPARDGSRPGTFQIPLRPEQMTKFALRTLVYHETVPGHHFQIAIELENQSVPRFRQVRAFGGISALGEGWALYAERLAAESGWYENDLEGLLGQLDDELFRARRLVVDTGLHAKRWTRQQAIDYGIEVSEVERYVVNAGQACAYMIGQLKILELRDRARSTLGNRFSEKEFHNQVLGQGTLPLDLLEQHVNQYLGGR